MCIRDSFEGLGLEVPETEAEFFDLLQAIKDAGYIPLAMGTHDLWEAATMGYQNIGPTYWKGEEGRLGLIYGTIGYDEDGFVEAFEALARWIPYLPDGYQAISYPDSQNLFTLGMAAIFPAGSWEIGVFRGQNPDFEMGAFKPPVPEGAETCYISDHVDIAMGVNAASPNLPKLFSTEAHSAINEMNTRYGKVMRNISAVSANFSGSSSVPGVNTAAINGAASMPMPATTNTPAANEPAM